MSHEHKGIELDMYETLRKERRELVAKVRKMYTEDIVALDTADIDDAEYFLVHVGASTHAVPIREKIPRDGAPPVALMDRLAELVESRRAYQEDTEKAA